MLEPWNGVPADEQDDDLVCMNGRACDHPYCPEHSDFEDMTNTATATKDRAVSVLRCLTEAVGKETDEQAAHVNNPGETHAFK